MSSKISLLPAATSSDHADLLTIVTVGGANKKITVADVLHNVGGQAFTIQTGGSGNFGWDSLSNYSVQVASGKQMGFYQGGNFMGGWDGSGNAYLICLAGAAASMQGNGAVITITAAGALSLLPLAGQVSIIGGWFGTAAYWTTPPSDVWAAIERIANVVSAGGGTPIP